MITHLEPDILECEVKWALGSITMNKASGGDRIPLELFQILKDFAITVAPRALHNIYFIADTQSTNRIKLKVSVVETKVKNI